MRFDDDFDEGGGGASILYMALGVSAFILAVIGIVVAVNKKNNSSSGNYQKYLEANASVTETTTEEDKEIKRTADDLDIWDMYPDKTINADSMDDITPTPLPTISLSPEEEQESIDEEMDDGEHIKVELKDGSHEWLAINKKWERNNYDFTNLVDTNGKMKYYADGKNVSFLGIDVSRYQKDIDFIQVKEAGVQFVMIRVGARGYKTGEISLDEYFDQNIQRATDAGLDVGLYFYSQAITNEEATQEANLLLSKIGNYKIKYPIAIDMELVDNDVSRAETLTVADRTNVTATFLNAIAAAGYKPMIYGNKEWLLKRIDLGKFTTSSVWLADGSDMPDYPYQFAMWQYATDGTVPGITGPANMDICFIDYSAQ